MFQQQAQNEVQGFGESTMAELMELRKALNVGYSLPVSGQDSIRVESLDASLKVVSYLATHIKLWNDITKQDAYSTVEEYNRLDEYGDDAGGFVDAGVLPEEEDTTYSRQNQLVKYVGTTRAVGHPTTLIRTVPADIIAKETENGILWMLGKIERSLFNGNATVIPAEWNGLIQQIVAGGGNIIDMRGAPLLDKDVEDGADQIAQNYGTPQKMYANNTVFSDFAKQYFGFQRWQSPNAPTGNVGTPVKGMSTQAGDVAFTSDVFLRLAGGSPSAATSPKAPNAPTLAAASPTGTDGDFVAGDAGTYFYSATALNQYGESVAGEIVSAVTIAATNHVVLTVTDGGGTYGATGYKIYRTAKNGLTGTEEFMAAVPRASVSGVYQATTNATDLNADIPGTYTGVMLDMTEQSLAFKQLSPLIKMPLAMISPAIRWMQLLYGTPIVFAPKKNVVYKNIGRAT